MKYFGEHGGRVLRQFQGPKGIKFIAGAILTPETVEDWPIANRMALHNSGKVDWFGPPTEQPKPKEVKTQTPSKKDDKKKGSSRKSSKKQNTSK